MKARNRLISSTYRPLINKLLLQMCLIFIQTSDKILLFQSVSHFWPGEVEAELEDKTEFD